MTASGVSLPAGAQVLRIVFDGGSFNFNSATFTLTSAGGGSGGGDQGCGCTGLELLAFLRRKVA